MRKWRHFRTERLTSLWHNFLHIPATLKYPHCRICIWSIVHHMAFGLIDIQGQVVDVAPVVYQSLPVSLHRCGPNCNRDFSICFRFLFRSGNQEHPGDKFENTTVEILPVSVGKCPPRPYPVWRLCVVMCKHLRLGYTERSKCIDY